MRNAHCSTWSMARKLKITENEKHTQEIWRETMKNVKKKYEKYTM
jgi:hypothetical protein